MDKSVKPFDPKPEEKALIDRYYNTSREIRGAFLEQAIWIDHFLSDTLARYFCAENEKRALFFSEVVNGVDFRFSTRITLLKSILETLRPDLREKYSDLCNALDKIRRFRNRLAHSHPRADKGDIAKAIEGAITLCFYEDGKRKEQRCSMDDVKNRLNESSLMLKKLIELRAELIPDLDKRV